MINEVVVSVVVTVVIGQSVMSGTGQSVCNCSFN